MSGSTGESRAARTPHAVILATSRTAVTWATARVCGVSVLRRHLVTLAAAGVRHVTVAVRQRQMVGDLRQAAGDPGALGLTVAYHSASGTQAAVTALQSGATVLVLEVDYVLDDRVVRALVASAGGGLARQDQTRDDGAPAAILVCASQPTLVRRRRIGRAAEDASPAPPEATQVRLEGSQPRAIGPEITDGNGWYAGAVLLGPAAVGLLRPGGDEAAADWNAVLSRLIQDSRVASLDIAQLPTYIPDIRRHLPMFWRRLTSKADLAQVKDQLIARAQKRTLDVMAWHVHRPIESWLTYHVSEWPVTPNQVTVLTNAVAFGIAGLYLTGHLLTGALLAFTVNILDGVDGKLARVRGATSKLGHIEHSFDCLFEQAWYAAFAWAVYAAGGWGLLPLQLGLVMLVADAFARHVSMQFQDTMGVPLADYAPFDRAFRRFDGRRNIYSLYIVGGVALGVPLYSLVLMAGHAALTGAIYAIRAIGHLHAADRGLSRPHPRQP